MNGEIILSGACYLPWHEVKFQASQVQVIPKILRRYPSEMGILKKFILASYKVILRIKRKLKNQSKDLFSGFHVLTQRKSCGFFACKRKTE